MRGFPNHLNTKQDYQNCMVDFPNETKAELERLLSGRFVWQDTAILEVGGLEDDTHRVIETEDGRFQQELVEDKNAEIFRLGFTVEEVEELIK